MSSQDKTFADLGVDPPLCEALAAAGITHPFPIQSMTLPVAMSGHDIIGQAKTGTGKTLGFTLPLLQRVSGPGEPGWDELAAGQGFPQALVVVPTRELAVQVAGDVELAGSRRSARVLTVYGGRAYEPQIEALKRGVEIVVGTPGRLIDLSQQGHLSLAHARIVVLDEADEMLDLGFLPDVERLLGMTPAGRQTMLFSATMPGAVVTLARRYMTQPTHIRAADPDDTGATVKATAQFVYRAHSLDKIEVLARLLQAEGRGLSIIFTRTKRTAAKVADELADRGFASAAIHGDLGQGAREQALRAFRNGKVDVLVATDVAARGIDVDDVTHVVNYQCPEDEKTYLHRIGRTGRAGNTGTAVTFVDWDDLPRWGLIDKALDLGIPEPEETYSTSEHLFAELNIPTTATGVLPRAARTRAGLGAEHVEDLGETGRGRGPAGGKRGGAAHGGRGGDRDRDKDRDRDRDRTRGRSRRAGRDDATATTQPGAGPESELADDATRPRRRRRRTRGGRPIEAGDGAGTTSGSQADSAADVATRETTPSPAQGSAEQGSADGDRPRRRRRRGGRGRGRGSEAGGVENGAANGASGGSENGASGSGAVEAAAPQPLG